MSKQSQATITRNAHKNGVRYLWAVYSADEFRKQETDTVSAEAVTFNLHPDDKAFARSEDLEFVLGTAVIDSRKLFLLSCIAMTDFFENRSVGASSRLKLLQWAMMHIPEYYMMPQDNSFVYAESIGDKTTPEYKKALDLYFDLCGVRIEAIRAMPIDGHRKDHANWTYHDPIQNEVFQDPWKNRRD